MYKHDKETFRVICPKFVAKFCSQKPKLMKHVILTFDLSLTWPVTYSIKIKHALESSCWDLSIAACPVSLYGASFRRLPGGKGEGVIITPPPARRVQPDTPVASGLNFDLNKPVNEASRKGGLLIYAQPILLDVLHIIATTAFINRSPHHLYWYYWNLFNYFILRLLR